MDIAKAFDCLPHKLPFLNTKAWGLSNFLKKLLQSYLGNRKQRIKIENSYSEWDGMFKGVPQGSILCSVLFNVFIMTYFILYILIRLMITLHISYRNNDTDKVV